MVSDLGGTPGSPHTRSVTDSDHAARGAASDADRAPRGHGGHGPSAHHGIHAHAPDPDADRRRLAAALAFIVGFMAVEVVVGIVAASLALLADAAHMLTDAGALGLALVAVRLAARPPAGGYTFGLKRAEILSAQLNGATLLATAVFIVYEGVRRLITPPEVEGAAVLIVGLLGAGVNIVGARLLAGSSRRSLNVEGAFQHILTDMLASLGAALAGLIVILTGFSRADGLVALAVAALMVAAAYRLLRDSGRVLLEAAPRGVEPDAIGRAMAAVPSVAEVHDLHVWEVTSGFPALSAHVLVDAGDDCHERRRELERLLRSEFGIEHTTLQVDHEQSRELLAIETPEPSGQ
jgi:cobalt-zinc-cadmium efflux system protein